MHRRHLWLLAASLIVALGLVTAASARVSHSSAPKVKVGGTLLFGAEQEVDCLNLLLNPCNQFWGQVFQSPVIRPAYVIQPDFSYKPDLVSKVALKLRPMRLTYYIRKQAKWNDGVPVTAKDFTFTFKKPYADWKDLFSPYVLPQHALAGADFSTVWNDGIVNPKSGKPISDGPFVLTQWQKGSQITEVRNPSWWGPHKPYLNSIIFRFLTNTNTEIQQVRGGEVDAIYPQPQLA